MEAWKPVVGFEGLYEVSDQGRVKALDFRSRGSVKILKPFEGPGGYLRVNLRNPLPVKPRQIMKSVHILVAEAFIGPRPEGYDVCHSPDSDKANNRLENLRYDTRVANMADDRSLGGKRSAVLSDQDRIDIHEIYRRGWMSIPQLNCHYNIAMGTVQQIVRTPNQINRLVEKYPNAVCDWKCPDWVSKVEHRTSGFRLTPAQRRQIIRRNADGNISTDHLAREFSVGQFAIAGLIKRHQATAKAA